jgi:hypothetical protein
MFKPCNVLSAHAFKCEPQLVHEVFAASSQLVFTTLGYNSAFKSRRQKIYTEQDCLCTAFIRDVKLAPDVKSFT